jgi:hypothetical protein
MLDTSKEYFTNGSEVMLLHNGRVQNFNEVPEHPELASIIENEPDLKAILNDWYPNNPLQQQKTLANCRFGALNFHADFINNESSADFCVCPKRGNCPGENIVCKPLSRGSEQFSSMEITVMLALSGADKNTAIANKLGFCLGTFFVFKTNIYTKVKSVINKPILTKQQLAKFLFLEGLL